MAITTFNMINRLPGTGSASTLGTYPYHNVLKVAKTTSIVNQFGVWPLVPGGASTRPTVGQLFPLGNR
jgi:hypothetical protein